MIPVLIRNRRDMADWSAQQRASGKRVALVPTMGALHAGHLTLVREASERSDVVVVTIFVNPTQFGPGEDLDAYPRTLDEDVQALTNQGITAVVFAPEVSEIYPVLPNLTWVEVASMGDYLCGATRPGHFKGVTTVVSRLLAICSPSIAIFGLKDAQQFFILQRMTLEMGFNTDLIGIPTVREPDGLALSSRNRYLTPDERAEAARLSQAVQKGKQLLLETSPAHIPSVLAAIRQDLSSLTFGVMDYAEIVDTADLQPVLSAQPGQKLLVAVAVKFGRARLIDNSIVEIV